MRTFLVFFIIAWLISIASGIYQPGAIFLFVGIAAIVGINYLLKLSLPFYVATLALLILGYLYGTAPAKVSKPCILPTDSVMGVITKSTIKENKTQYVFTGNGGCTFLVFAPRFPEYLPGQKLQISGGTLQTPDKIDEDYQGYAEYLKRKNIDASWYQPVIMGIDNESSVFAKWRQVLRQTVQNVFIEPDASLISATLFAEQGTIPEQFVQQFRDTGVTHVLAISGLNMSLIAGALYLVLLLLPLSKLARALCASTLVWAYILFIGAPVSVVRAGVFWTVVLLAWHWQVLISLPTVMLLTALIMVTVYPLILGDVGFQLSIAGILGIGLMLFFTQRMRLNKWRWFWRALYSSVIISLGATLTTWPLVTYHFGTVSLISVVANILIVPVVAPLILFGVATLGLVPFSYLAASFLAFGAHLLIIWMDVITFWLSKIPGAVLNNVTISEGALLAYYLGLMAVAIFMIKIQGRSWREIWQ